MPGSCGFGQGTQGHQRRAGQSCDLDGFLAWRSPRPVIGTTSRTSSTISDIEYYTKMRKLATSSPRCSDRYRPAGRRGTRVQLPGRLTACQTALACEVEAQTD